MSRFAGRVARTPQAALTAQPAPLLRDGLQVLLRGFIGNRQTLLREGRALGLIGEHEDDAALCAVAYRRWGADLNAHVLGEYAVALFDPAAQTLLLTRDGLGLQPLFYSGDGERLAFASHLDALLTIVEPGALDTRYLGEHLTFAPHAFDRTPFVNIAKLIPGHSLRWTPGRLEQIRSWRLSQAPDVPDATDREHEARFRELLAEGLRQCIPATGRTWSELSGGQDSSSIVCAAADAGITGLETLSFVFPHCPEADETPYIEAVTARTGYPAHRLDIQRTPPFARVPTTFHGEPNLVLPYTAFIERYEDLMREHDVQVMLSGNGGDHVMIGDGLFPLDLADHLQRGDGRALWQGLKDWQAHAEHRRSLRFLFGHYAWTPAWRHWRRQPVSPRFTIPVPEWIAPDFLRRFRAAAADARCEPPDHGSSPSRQYFIERVHDFSALISQNAHQAVRGFEFRYPLMYRPLVEFLYALPWRQKLRPDGDRHLQRRAMHALLPAEVRDRVDKAVMTRPVLEGFRRSPAWFDLLTRQPQLIEHGLVDAARWQDAVRRARLGQIEGVSLFLAAAALEAWLQGLCAHRADRPAANPEVVGI